MRRRSLALSLLFVGLFSPAGAAELEQVARVVWEGDVVFGVSGLEVSADGRRFDAVSDAGWRFEGRLVRRGGTLESIEMEEVTPILGNDGLPVSARRVRDWSDAEGLATASDGTSWIVFERWSRAQRFDPGNPVGKWIRDHPDFYTWRENRQLEAVAVDDAGIVLTMPERPTSDGFPVYALRNGEWGIDGHIPQRGSFSIVGADFAPDGTLWLLERKHFLGRWWQNRISRLDPDDFESIETVWTGRFNEFYNLEGLAVWQTPGGLRLLCVTDNNAKRGVPTELVEFRLIE